MYSSFQLHLRPTSSSLSVSLSRPTGLPAGWSILLRVFAHASPSFSDSFSPSPYRCIASPPPWRPHLCTISQGDSGRLQHFGVPFYKGFTQNEMTWRQIELPNPCQVCDVVLSRIQGDWSAKSRQLLNFLERGWVWLNTERLLRWMERAVESQCGITQDGKGESPLCSRCSSAQPLLLVKNALTSIHVEGSIWLNCSNL